MKYSRSFIRRKLEGGKVYQGILDYHSVKFKLELAKSYLLKRHTMKVYYKGAD
jgi:hypothetical protein